MRSAIGLTEVLRGPQTVPGRIEGASDREMLIYRRTSVLESSAQTLVNTVNCVGVMGKGIAKAFKERDPAMFAAYKDICDRKLLEPGKLWLWQGSDSWVLNFPTKINWRHPSKLEWVEAGLEKFIATYASRGIKEISFPRLGCGNGNLNWSDVKPLMERYLSALNIPVYIHDHTVDIGLPEHLEHVPRQLRAEGVKTPSFDGFIDALRRATELADGGLVELASKKPFQARIDDNGGLTIQTETAVWLLDAEDLRGVWVSLLNGLVTREKAGWSVSTGADPLLSLLSLLPQVRPVEIQRRTSSHSELAVELRPQERGTVPVSNSSDQHLLTWA
jgi:O-acetyl-ADP-ribose deacetylase (regulator of RNase III)